MVFGACMFAVVFIEIILNTFDFYDDFYEDAICPALTAAPKLKEE